MSFWDMNDGSKLDASGEFDMGGLLEPIPNNTGCIAAIEEAKWDEYDVSRYISLKWRVVKPEQYANRVIFQKVKVLDQDPQKAAKAKRMLAAIDANAGGKLLKLTSEPTDMDLMGALAGKMMAIKVMVWKIAADQAEDGQERSGNWISAVAPVKKGAAPAPAPKPAPAPDPEPVDEDYEDDIPFN